MTHAKKLRKRLGVFGAQPSPTIPQFIWILFASLCLFLPLVLSERFSVDGPVSILSIIFFLPILLVGFRITLCLSVIVFSNSVEAGKRVHIFLGPPVAILWSKSVCVSLVRGRLVLSSLLCVMFLARLGLLWTLDGSFALWHLSRCMFLGRVSLMFLLAT